MRSSLFLLVALCFAVSPLQAEQDFATIVVNITTEINEINKPGFQEGRIQVLRQGLKDIRKWPDKSEETGPLSRKAFLALLAALKNDPMNEAAIITLYATMDTIWADIPKLDARKSAATTDKFLKSAANAYSTVRRSLTDIKKPVTEPRVPDLPESYLKEKRYFSGPPPRPEEIADEADRAIYKQEYDRYVKELADRSSFISAPNRIASLDQSMVDVMRVHPNKEVGKIEAQMAFFKMAGISKDEIEKIVLGGP